LSYLFISRLVRAIWKNNWYFAFLDTRLGLKKSSCAVHLAEVNLCSSTGETSTPNVVFFILLSMHNWWETYCTLCTICESRKIFFEIFNNCPRTKDYSVSQSAWYSRIVLLGCSISHSNLISIQKKSSQTISDLREISGVRPKIAILTLMYGIGKKKEVSLCICILLYSHILLTIIPCYL